MSMPVNASSSGGADMQASINPLVITRQNSTNGIMVAPMGAPRTSPPSNNNTAARRGVGGGSGGRERHRTGEGISGGFVDVELDARDETSLLRTRATTAAAEAAAVAYGQGQHSIPSGTNAPVPSLPMFVSDLLDDDDAPTEALFGTKSAARTAAFSGSKDARWPTISTSVVVSFCFLLSCLVIVVPVDYIGITSGLQAWETGMKGELHRLAYSSTLRAVNRIVLPAERSAQSIATTLVAAEMTCPIISSSSTRSRFTNAAPLTSWFLDANHTCHQTRWAVAPLLPHVMELDHLSTRYFYIAHHHLNCTQQTATVTESTLYDEYSNATMSNNSLLLGTVRKDALYSVHDGDWIVPYSRLLATFLSCKQSYARQKEEGGGFDPPSNFLAVELIFSSGFYLTVWCDVVGATADNNTSSASNSSATTTTTPTTLIIGITSLVYFPDNASQGLLREVVAPENMFSRVLEWLLARHVCQMPPPPGTEVSYQDVDIATIDLRQSSFVHAFVGAVALEASLSSTDPLSGIVASKIIPSGAGNARQRAQWSRCDTNRTSMSALWYASMAASLPAAANLLPSGSAAALPSMVVVSILRPPLHCEDLVELSRDLQSQRCDSYSVLTDRSKHTVEAVARTNAMTLPQFVSHTSECTNVGKYHRLTYNSSNASQPLLTRRLQVLVHRHVVSAVVSPASGASRWTPIGGQSNFLSQNMSSRSSNAVVNIIENALDHPVDDSRVAAATSCFDGNECEFPLPAGVGVSSTHTAVSLHVGWTQTVIAPLDMGLIHIIVDDKVSFVTFTGSILIGAQAAVALVGAVVMFMVSRHVLNPLLNFKRIAKAADGEITTAMSVASSVAGADGGPAWTSVPSPQSWNSFLLFRCSDVCEFAKHFAAIRWLSKILLESLKHECALRHVSLTPSTAANAPAGGNSSTSFRPQGFTTADSTANESDDVVGATTTAVASGGEARGVTADDTYVEMKSPATVHVTPGSAQPFALGGQKQRSPPPPPPLNVGGGGAKGFSLTSDSSRRGFVVSITFPHDRMELVQKDIPWAAPQAQSFSGGGAQSNSHGKATRGGGKDQNSMSVSMSSRASNNSSVRDGYSASSAPGRATAKGGASSTKRRNQISPFEYIGIVCDLVAQYGGTIERMASHCELLVSFGVDVDATSQVVPPGNTSSTSALPSSTSNLSSQQQQQQHMYNNILASKKTKFGSPSGDAMVDSGNTSRNSDISLPLDRGECRVSLLGTAKQQCTPSQATSHREQQHQQQASSSFLTCPNPAEHVMSFTRAVVQRIHDLFFTASPEWMDAQAVNLIPVAARSSSSGAKNPTTNATAGMQYDVSGGGGGGVSAESATTTTKQTLHQEDAPIVAITVDSSVLFLMHVHHEKYHEPFLVGDALDRLECLQDIQRVRHPHCCVVCSSEFASQLRNSRTSCSVMGSSSTCVRPDAPHCDVCCVAHDKQQSQARTRRSSQSLLFPLDIVSTSLSVGIPRTDTFAVFTFLDPLFIAVGEKTTFSMTNQQRTSEILSVRVSRLRDRTQGEAILHRMHALSPGISENSFLLLTQNNASSTSTSTPITTITNPSSVPPGAGVVLEGSTNSDDHVPHRRSSGAAMVTLIPASVPCYCSIQDIALNMFRIMLRGSTCSCFVPELSDILATADETGWDLPLVLPDDFKTLEGCASALNAAVPISHRAGQVGKVGSAPLVPGPAFGASSSSSRAYLTSSSSPSPQKRGSVGMAPEGPSSATAPYHVVSRPPSLSTFYSDFLSAVIPLVNMCIEKEQTAMRCDSPPSVSLDTDRRQSQVLDPLSDEDRSHETTRNSHHHQHFVDLLAHHTTSTKHRDDGEEDGDVPADTCGSSEFELPLQGDQPNEAFPPVAFGDGGGDSGRSGDRGGMVVQVKVVSMRKEALWEDVEGFGKI